MISMRQPWRSMKRVYMRWRSAANSAASSPPVPARISTMALRSSSGSRGSERRQQLRLEVGDAPARGARLFGARLGGHLGVVNGNELAHLRELVLGSCELGRHLDHRLKPAVLPAELRELFRVAERGRDWRAPARLRRRGRGRPLTDRGAPGQCLSSRSTNQPRPSRPLAAPGFANFWRKRSIRPAVSIRRCLPV